MIRLINNLKSKKGFTLIELIVVLAVLAIIMAIAIPSFMGVQDEARINADAATAQQIIKAARLLEVKNADNVPVTEADVKDYGMLPGGWPVPKTYDADGTGGKEFELSGGGLDGDGDEVQYVITWTPNKGRYTEEQTVTENKEFEITKKATP
jgi:prepilin-type N-terminal cleavage/methylation domain-containing protein